MTTEDYNNIDDLVDYKDFESGLESNTDQDSFNDDIMKLYEDHKKKGAGEKTSEVQNVQRPMSKYQRNVVSAGIREDGQESIPNNQTNDNASNNINLNNNDLNSNSNSNEIKLDNLLTRLNTFIHNHRITRSEFMDNPKIYFSIDEFKESFRKIRFEISLPEINYLFTYNNNSNDGNGEYVLGLTFLKNFSDKIVWSDINSKDRKNNFNYTGSKVNVLNDFDDYVTYNTKNDFDKNEEFKIMSNEIMDIVTKESRPKSTAKIQKRNLSSAIDTKKNLVKNNGNRPQTHIINTNTNILNKNNSVSKIKSVRANSSYKYLQIAILKKKAEEEMVRVAIDRKNKEVERDCIHKMSDANNMAEDLGITKSYSAFIDENDGDLICRVYDKTTKKTTDLDIKKFLMDYKKLAKQSKKLELTKYYQNSKDDDLDVTGKAKDSLLNYGRELRQKKIKEVLIDSLILKIKLKRQLKALRDKNLVDSSVISANLKLINLDDDNI